MPASTVARFARFVTAALAAVTVTVTGITPTPAAADGVATTRYVPVTPTRLADTREPVCGCERLDANTIRVQVAGVGGVPADATAAALNITVADTDTAGFATVYPAGTTRPWVSNLNWGAGQIVPNATIVTLAGGAVDIFTNTPAAVVVDVTGAFVPATSSTAGRYVPVVGGVIFNATIPARGEATVDTGMWARGASAALVTITGQADFPGFITAWPEGATRPWVSAMNPSGGGRVASNTLIVPVDGEGRLRLYSVTTTAVTVSVHGYFTGTGAPDATTGLYVPTTPTRILDTREAGPTSGRPVTAGGVVAVDTIDATAVNVNVTIVDATSPGMWRAAGVGAWFNTATGGTYPTSTAAAQAAFIAPTGAGIEIAPSATTHIVIDLNGYFTGPTRTIANEANTFSPPDTTAYPVAVRSGHPCETAAVAAIAAKYPQHEWLLDHTTFRIVSTLTYEGVRASGATWGGGVSMATGWTIPTVIGIELIGTACSGYVPIHEFAHAVSVASMLVSLGRFGGGADPQPAANAYSFESASGCKIADFCPGGEVFADCAAKALGAAPAGRPRYTECADPGMQATSLAAITAPLMPAPALSECEVTGPSTLIGSNPAAVTPTERATNTLITGTNAGLPGVLPAGTIIHFCTVTTQIGAATWQATNRAIGTPDGVVYVFDRAATQWTPTI